MVNAFTSWVSDAIIQLGPFSGPAVLLAMGSFICMCIYSIFYFIRWILGYPVDKDTYIVFCIGCFPYVNLFCIFSVIVALVYTFIFEPFKNKLQNIRENNVKKRK